MIISHCEKTVMQEDFISDLLIFIILAKS